MAEDLGPIPAHEFDFHFKSGRICLDLVATVGERWRRSFERLREPDDFSRWTVEAGVLESAPSVSAPQLEAARTLREAIYRVARPDGCPPAADDIAVINRWASIAPLFPRLGINAKEVTWHSERPVDAVLATIARDAIDLLAGPLQSRIRECAADDCARSSSTPPVRAGGAGAPWAPAATAPRRGPTAGARERQPRRRRRRWLTAC